HGAQRALVADPGTDEAGEHDRDHECPRRAEEAESEAKRAFGGHHQQEDDHPNAPGDVPGPPRKRGLRWAEPDRVYAVNLIISADPHARPPSPLSPRTGQPATCQFAPRHRW